MHRNAPAPAAPRALGPTPAPALRGSPPAAHRATALRSRGSCVLREAVARIRARGLAQALVELAFALRELRRHDNLCHCEQVARATARVRQSAAGQAQLAARSGPG